MVIDFANMLARRSVPLAVVFSQLVSAVPVLADGVRASRTSSHGLEVVAAFLGCIVFLGFLAIPDLRRAVLPSDASSAGCVWGCLPLIILTGFLGILVKTGLAKIIGYIVMGIVYVWLSATTDRRHGHHHHCCDERGGRNSWGSW